MGRKFGLCMLVFVLLCSTACADVERCTTDGSKFVFGMDGDTLVSVESYFNTKTLEFPSRVNSFPSALRNTLYFNVTNIRVTALQYIDNLTEVFIPSTVEQIEGNIFFNCPQLTSIRVAPESACYAVIDGVLYDKNRKELVAYPRGKTDTSLVIPEGIRSIGSKAFYGCNRLTRIVLPSTLEYMGDNPFIYCNDLQSVEYADTVPAEKQLFAQEDAFVLSLSEPDFIEVVSVLASRLSSGNVVVPSGIQGIGNYACYDTYLASVTFPNSLHRIGDFAFYNCQYLESIDLQQNLFEIGESAFESCGITELVLPEGLAHLFQKAFYKNYSLRSVHIPSTLFEIPSYAFAECKALAAVSIAEDSALNTISDHAFYGCDLYSFEFPKGVMSIGEQAFLYNRNLKSVVLPSGIVGINNGTFHSCSSLSEVILPEGLTYIDEDAFLYCKALTEIKFPSTLQAIGANAFGNCDNLVIEIEQDSPLLWMVQICGAEYRYADANDWLTD